MIQITQRETTVLKALIKEDGEIQDVRSDTISIAIKKGKDDALADAVYTGVADVATYGEDGIAYWMLDVDDTDLPVGKYFFSVKRVHGTETYYPVQGIIEVKQNLYE